jgi:hypothetical protein
MASWLEAMRTSGRMKVSVTSSTRASLPVEVLSGA